MSAATEARPEARERFERSWANPRGWRGVFMVVQHKSVGMRYMVTAFVFFLLGGLQALFMRAQLAQPGSDFVSAQAYNELFTMHGTTMMFLFAVPFLEGLATYLLPLMIGSRDLPFPRYNAFNYWCYLFGGIILYSSYLFAMVPDSGWFAYVPLSGPDFADRSMDFWLFGLTLAEIAAVGAAVEILVAILRSRAPGMSLNRMPIFAWTMLAVACMIIVAFVPLIVASLLLELDRVIGTAFFDSALGGDPLLWQHLFWIFGHPEVYVLFLPGAAIISHVIPVHARHPLVAYPLVVVALAATAVMSLGLWVHHMYTVGLPVVTVSFFTAASMSIALASGLQVFAWIATLWSGRPRLTVPMLWSLGFIVTFVLGGITGVMVAAVAFDEQVHDTYFVVAHLHYVLIGGMVFPLFAGLHHWWSKFTGRRYGTIPAHLAFWLVFLGFHATFFPMHLTGLWGMPRRVFTYPEELGLGTVNLISTIGAAVLAAGVLVLTANLVHARLRGAPAPMDPWDGDSLEWRTGSPPSPANWTRIPVVAGRHPGWEGFDETHPANDALREAFDARPEGFRAIPMTTVVSAEPDGAAVLPGPSIWPIVPPLGLAVVAVALLTEWYPLALVGAVAALVGFAGWAWSNEREHLENDLRPLAGAFPFEEPGPRAMGWWGALSAAIVAVVGIATLAFSALYLQVNSSDWAAGGTLDRPWLFGGVAAGILVALLASRQGSRRGGGGAWGSADPRVRRTQLVAGAVSAAAGAAALALLVLVWSTSGIVPSAHAYASSVWVLLGVQALITAGAVAATAVALMGRIRHTRDSRPSLLLQYAGVLWVAAALSWGVTWIAIDVLPALVI